MSWRSNLVVGVALAAVLVGLALAILEPAPLSPGDSRGLTVLAGIAMFLVLGYHVWRGRRWRAGAGRSTSPTGGDGSDGDGPDGEGPHGDGPDVDGQDGGGPESDGRNGNDPDGAVSGSTALGGDGPSAQGPSGQGPTRSWTSAGPLLGRAPERTPADRPLAGDRLARLTEDAARVAREDGSVEAGLAIVRPQLRAATRDVLAAGGGSAAEAGARLDGGKWTDDPVAASVLSDAVPPPPTSLRDRIRAWLFPETVVRRRIARTVDAIGVLAASRLPTLPGQEVPRTRSVAPPRLESLEVGPDGSLRRGPGRSTAEFRDGEGRTRDRGIERRADSSPQRPDGTITTTADRSEAPSNGTDQAGEDP